jgi:hypothetical protein
VPFQSIGKITFGINESKAFGVLGKPVGHVLLPVGLLAGAALSAVATTSITLRTAAPPTHAADANADLTALPIASLVAVGHASLSLRLLAGAAAPALRVR